MSEDDFESRKQEMLDFFADPEMQALARQRAQRQTEAVDWQRHREAAYRACSVPPDPTAILDDPAPEKVLDGIRAVFMDAQGRPIGTWFSVVSFTIDTSQFEAAMQGLAITLQQGAEAFAALTAEMERDGTT